MSKKEYPEQLAEAKESPLLQKTFNKDSANLPSIAEISQHIYFDYQWNLPNFDHEKYLLSAIIRTEYCKYNFCLLNHNFFLQLRQMCKELKLTRIAELCAGAGWLSYWMEKYRIPLQASIDNGSWAKTWKHKGAKVVKKSAVNYVKEHPEIELFILSWPNMNNVAARIWKRMQPKQLLLYIGESNGGCTANERFFKLVEPHEVEDRWQLNDTFVAFHGLHDSPYLFKK